MTGANGFIGRHLVPSLRERGHTVVEATRVDGDVADSATWARFPRTDVVVHLAGRSFVPDSWTDPRSFVESNVVGTWTALEHCRAHGARMVYLSSYLYGAPAHLPIAETAPLAVMNPYALTKKQAEQACAFYASTHGLGITVLRPFNVYGSGQPASFLVPAVLEQLRGGVEIVVKDATPRRDYVYVTDVVSAVVQALPAPRGFRVFNVGSGVSHSVADLVDLVQAVWGTSLPVRDSADRRPHEIMDTVADIRAAAAGLGWAPRFSLRAGLEEMRSRDR
ncbi:MAG: NAD(P)-dependent oxidoreductase [Usitatibacter sp.]